MDFTGVQLAPQHEFTAHVMELHFHRVYEVADMMAAIVNTYGAFDELDWDSPDVNACLKKFSKRNLLSHFCFTHLRNYDHKKFRKDPETIDVEFIESGFERYGITCARFNEFLSRELSRTQADEGEEEDHDLALRLWMEEQWEAFTLLWEKVTNEVVHLLFGNRIFLLDFNLQLAEFRQERGDAPSSRCAIPQWVKKAVYFRENGKCALCKKDLSGLIAIDPKQHYDHIVPLKALGVNDSCNIQLLCKQCNLEKGASPAVTSSVYDSWWTE